MGAAILNRRRCVSLLATFVAMAAGTAVVEAQTVSVDRFVGAWELVDWRATDESGSVRFPYGENAQGQIAYTANGRMSAHLMRPLDEEPRQHLSYWGGFTIDTDAETVTHHVVGSSQESFVGTDLVREYVFQGADRLVLIAGSNRLTWRRVR